MSGESGPSWSEVCPGLLSLFTDLAQAPAGAQPLDWKAEWRDRARKAAPNTGPLRGVTLTLKITSIVGVGDDDVRRTQSSPTSELQETIYGLRRVTLRLETSSSVAEDAQWALSILERIRTRLARTRVVDALNSLNVAVISVGATNDISSKAQQHTQSRAAMDVFLNMVASDADPVPTGWIRSVIITSNIEDTNGTLLPRPPNFTITATRN